MANFGDDNKTKLAELQTCRPLRKCDLRLLHQIAIKGTGFSCNNDLKPNEPKRRGSTRPPARPPRKRRRRELIPLASRHHINKSSPPAAMPPPPQEENKQASANTAVNILQEISEILVSHQLLCPEQDLGGKRGGERREEEMD